MTYSEFKEWSRGLGDEIAKKLNPFCELINDVPASKSVQDVERREGHGRLAPLNTPLFKSGVKSVCFEMNVSFAMHNNVSSYRAR